MSAPLIESRQGRRIIGRLAAGEDLVEGLIAVCNEHQVRCGSLQAAGVLDEVSLAHYDKSSRAMGRPRWFRTPMQILSLAGTCSEQRGRPQLQLNLVVSRKGDNGIEVLGGVVVSAKVLHCEYIIDAMDDVVLRRGVDRPTGLAIWQEMIGGSGGAEGTADGGNGTGKEQGVKGDWAAAVAVSQAAQAAGADESREEIAPYRPIKVGDFLDHGKFGRCVIERIDNNEEFATVRLKNNRRVRLNVEVLNLRYDGDEEGHQVFVSAPKGA